MCTMSPGHAELHAGVAPRRATSRNGVTRQLSFQTPLCAGNKLPDSLKPKRINVLHPDFMSDEFTSEDFKDSLVIFDDVDVFQ